MRSVIGTHPEPAETRSCTPNACHGGSSEAGARQLTEGRYKEPTIDDFFLRVSSRRSHYRRVRKTPQPSDSSNPLFKTRGSGANRYPRDCLCSKSRAFVRSVEPGQAENMEREIVGRSQRGKRSTRRADSLLRHHTARQRILGPKHAVPMTPGHLGRLSCPYWSAEEEARHR